MVNKRYYICTDGVNSDRIYGDQQPTCLSETEVIRLSAEWGVNLFEQMHEASEDEITEYGIYDE